MKETYHDKQQKIIIDSSANKLNVSLETADWLFKRQEEILKQMREDLKEESNMFSSEHIHNKVLTLTSEHPYYEDHFERNSKLRFIHLVKVIEIRKKNW